MANPDNWYKRYPQAYIQDTRHLSKDARFVYSEFIDRQRMDERPLPDDQRWLVNAFHSDRRTVKRGLEELIADGKLVRTPDGLVNPKCMADISARLHQRDVNTRTARSRTQKRRGDDRATTEVEQRDDRAMTEVEQRDDRAMTADEHSATEMASDNNVAPEVSLNETGATCARNESQKEDREDSSPTPHGVGREGGEPSADDLHRQAYLDGRRIKQGVATKSARAKQRCTGELDGSNGILFVGGKLTITGPARDELQTDFPGIDINAVCNRAGAELAGKRGYPSYDQAMAELRKAADIIQAVRGKQSGAAQKRVTRARSADEQRLRADKIMAGDGDWDSRRNGANPHDPESPFTDPEVRADLQATFDRRGKRLSLPLAPLTSVNGKSASVAAAETRH